MPQSCSIVTHLSPWLTGRLGRIPQYLRPTYIRPIGQSGGIGVGLGLDDPGQVLPDLEPGPHSEMAFDGELVKSSPHMLFQRLQQDMDQ